MLSSLYARKNREDGFTLIELLIVVIIIGILAAIALPIFIDQQKVAIDASVQSDVRNSVTNITNAQAQEAGTAKAAVSNANTTVALTAIARGSAAGATATTVNATKASSDLTNVPVLGGEYTVQGYNAGGKQYQGPTATDGKAFTFTASTGKFTSAPVSGGSGGSTGGGSNADPYAAGPTGVQAGWYNQNNELKWAGANIDFAFTYTLTSDSVTITATPKGNTGSINANSVLWCKSNADGSFQSMGNQAVFYDKNQPTSSNTYTCNTGYKPYSFFDGQQGNDNQDAAAYTSDFGGGDILYRPAVYFSSTAPNWTAAK